MLMFGTFWNLSAVKFSQENYSIYKQFTKLVLLLFKWRSSSRRIFSIVLPIWPQKISLSSDANPKIVELNAGYWATKKRRPIWPKKNFFFDFFMLRRLNIYKYLDFGHESERQLFLLLFLHPKFHAKITWLKFQSFFIFALK